MALANFLAGATGMSAQAHSLSQISSNIANINTVGYKRAETSFATLLSGEALKMDEFSVKPVDSRRIDAQGPLQTTGNRLDIAINGRGLFIVNTAIDGTGAECYTRAGDFTEKALMQADGSSSSYLTTKEGYAVMGFSADDDGVFSTQLSTIRTSTDGRIEGVPTTDITLKANVPVDESDHQQFGLAVVDNSYEGKTLTMNLDRTSVGFWDMSFDVHDGTIASPAAATPIQFSSVGKIVDAPTTVIDIAWDDGTTSSVTLHIDDLVQYAGEKTIFDIDQNGRGAGLLNRTVFDKDGIIHGHYSNGVVMPLGKLALARFNAPNKLEPMSNNLFRRTEEAGTLQIIDPSQEAPNTSFISEVLEQSNVDLADEFTKMIVTQKAYSSSATIFRTSDEVLQEIMSVKR